MFKQISIVGFGLIGSSLARRIKKDQIASRIVCVDINPNVCEKALELGITDDATTNLAQGVEGSDFVVLAVPVGAVGVVCEAISSSLEKGVHITDVGSVKNIVLETAKEKLPDHVCFVPAHPIAGTEHSGPEAGFAELFDERWTILTPDSTTPISAVEKVSAFWQAVGARIEIMDAHHHDLVLGITSHLPHLIAYTIVDTANSLEDDMKSEVIKYSASGFRGFTRIAASDPTMWRDVFLNNKTAVLEILQRFTEDLTAMQKAIRQGDGDYLFNAFTRTRDIRREVMGLGPEGFPAPPEITSSKTS